MPPTDGLLSIGRFAAATGLTLTTLRHYDEIGLLVPAFVDRTTGYRWYRPDQGRRADVVRRLRAVGVPLGDVADLLDTMGDPPRLGALLAAQADRLDEAAAAAADAQDLFTALTKELLAMATDQIDHPAVVGPLAAVRIWCPDLVAARTFYGGVLHLPELAVAPGWLVFDVQGAQLIVELVPPGDAEGESITGRFTGLSFAVDDAGRTCDELARQGVDIVGRPARQPWGGTLAHFADPAGNVLTLVQYPT
jgi:DNA-binding transcriptional MerR regulator/catechol 2,3-dioxygenase-like lactoylglutathione lyase family enzyme